MSSKSVAVSPVAQSIVNRIREQEARDPSVLKTTHAVREMLGGCSVRHLYNLLNNGEIESVMDGRSRRPVSASVYDYMCRLAVASHPIGAPPAKWHDGRHSLRKPLAKRIRTPQELAALQRANAARHEAALARKSESTVTQAEEI
jgi:hypothetical protein